MMKKKTENKYALLKQLIVLPLLAVLVMGLSNKEVRTEIVQGKKEIRIVVDGVKIPADHPDLKSIDFSKGFDSGQIIEALKLNNIEANSVVVESERPIIFIRTSAYVPGTSTEFEKHTTRNIVLDGNRLTSAYHYAIDNRIVSKKEFEEKGETGFKNVVFISGEDASNKYGVKYKGVIADATSGVANFIVTKDKGKLNEVYDENLNVKIGAEIVDSDPRTDIFNQYMLDMHMDGNVIIDPLVKDCPYVEIDGEVVSDKIIIGESDIEKIGANQPPWSEDLYGKKYKFGMIFIQTKNIKSSKSITGKVTDEKGIPIAGVAILIKGTKTGTITDSEGNYELKSESPIETLVVVMKGFVKKEVDVEGSSVLNIVLKADTDSESTGWTLSGGINGVLSPNGDVTITPSTKNGISITQTGDKSKQPLFIVDGKEIDSMEDIRPDNIESISLLKDEAATDLFGETAKNGVMLITTKEEAKKKGNSKPSIGFRAQNTTDFQIKDIFKNVGTPLYIVDGKEVENMTALQPNDIESMSVLKDKSATALYGENYGVHTNNC